MGMGICFAVGLFGGCLYLCRLGAMVSSNDPNHHLAPFRTSSGYFPKLTFVMASLPVCGPMVMLMAPVRFHEAFGTGMLRIETNLGLAGTFLHALPSFVLDVAVIMKQTGGVCILWFQVSFGVAVAQFLSQCFIAVRAVIKQEDEQFADGAQI